MPGTYFAELGNVTPFPCDPNDTTTLEWDTVIDDSQWHEGLSPGEFELQIDYSDAGWSVEVHVDFQWTGSENFEVQVLKDGSPIPDSIQSFISGGGTTVTYNYTAQFSGVVDAEGIEVVVVDSGTADLTTLGTATVDGDYFKVSYNYFKYEGGGLGNPFPLQPGDFAMTMLGSVPGVDDTSLGGQVWRCVIIRNDMLVGSIEATQFLPMGSSSGTPFNNVFNPGVEFGPDGSLYIAGTANDNGFHVYKWTKDGDFVGDVESIFSTGASTVGAESFTKFGRRLFMLDVGLVGDTRTTSPIFGPGPVIKQTRIYEQDENGIHSDEHDVDEPAPKTFPSENVSAMFVDEEREILYVVFDGNISATGGTGSHSNSTYTTFKTYVCRYDLANRQTMTPLFEDGPPINPGGPASFIVTMHFTDGDVLCDGTVLATMFRNNAGIHETYRISPDGTKLGTWTFTIDGSSFLPAQAYCQDYVDRDYVYIGFARGTYIKVFISSGVQTKIPIYQDKGDPDGYYHNQGVVSIAQYADGCIENPPVPSGGVIAEVMLVG